MVIEVVVHADKLINRRPSTLPTSWLTINIKSLNATVLNQQDTFMKEIYYSKSPTTSRILKWFTRTDDIRILVCETELELIYNALQGTITMKRIHSLEKKK